MPKNHLPNEILYRIFKQIKREKTYDGTLAQCALTCRQWRQPAQAALYSALTIRSTAILDAIMETPKELENYVQSIEYYMKFEKSCMMEIALLFKNLLTFHSIDCCDALFKSMLRLLKKGFLPALQTIPPPDFDKNAQKNYEACLELMKDRITDITLTVPGKESGTYDSLHKKLDSFPKLDTIGMDYDQNKESMVWKDWEAVSTKNNIKTLRIMPSALEDFLSDTLIIPEPGVETLSVIEFDYMRHSFMLYVMQRFPHLKKLEIMTDIQEHIRSYEPRPLLDKSGVDLFLKYLYSIETVSGIVLEINVEEVSRRLLSLTQSLVLKELQETTFVLDFIELPLQNDAAVIQFTRIDSRSRIYIMVDQDIDSLILNLKLMEEVGSVFYRLQLRSITENLGKILNMVAVHCTRLNCLIIVNGRDSALECSPSNEDIVQNHTVRRLEFRHYRITPHLFTLIHKQFPCLEDLIIHGFYKWKIPGSHFPMIAPLMSIDYFRLRLDRYFEKAPFKFKKVFIKLETMEQETRYYDLDLESPEYIVENYLYQHINSTEADYKESIEDDSYMTLFIKCKSVTKFVPAFSPSFKKHLALY